MDVFRFVVKADPWREPRLGIFLDDGRTVVDLQAGHLSMRARPTPILRDVTAFRAAGAEAKRLCEEVRAWVASERPPGTTTDAERVEMLGPVEGASPGQRAPP